MWKTNLWSPRGKERRGINWEIGTNIHTLCWERLRAGGESEEEIKSFLMKVKEESEKVGL